MFGMIKNVTENGRMRHLADSHLLTLISTDMSQVGVALFSPF